MDQNIEVQEAVADPENFNENPQTDQELAADANMAANEFSQKIYDTIKEFEDKIPLVYMMKILSAIGIDLMSALLGTNMTYVADSIKKEFGGLIPPEESELIVA